MKPVVGTIIGPVDGSTNPVSAAISGDQVYSASFQLISTGSIGALKIQFSNDVVLSPSLPPTNWSDLTGETVSITGAGVFGIPKFDIAYGWIRAVYTQSSGSGNIAVNIHGLGF